MSLFTPLFPSFGGQLMPEGALDGLIANNGIRMGWMKAHTCPCTLGNDRNPGSADPGCHTCFGRGVYWDRPPVNFTGLVTYMHTSSAPDEPGSFADPVHGTVQRSEPTLTIPYSATTIWNNASVFDAYVEYDATSRFNSTMVVGENNALPYPSNAIVSSVTAYDILTKTSSALATGAYVVGVSGTVDLVGYPAGTAYTVEYTAVPVYIAYRSAGGMPHTRPFGNGASAIPRRFHIVALDLWTRARFGGDMPLSLVTAPAYSPPTYTGGIGDDAGPPLTTDTGQQLIVTTG